MTSIDSRVSRAELLSKIPTRDGFGHGLLHEALGHFSIGRLAIVNEAIKEGEGRFLGAVYLGGEESAEVGVLPDGLGDSGSPVYAIVRVSVGSIATPAPEVL